MNDLDSTSPLPPSPPPVERSLGERFTDVFTRPTQAMQDVARRPAWFVAALVIMAVMGIYTAANIHTIVPAQSEMQLEHATGPEVDMLEQQIEMFSDPPIWLRVVSGLGAAIGAALLGGLVFGLILHLFLKLSEGQGTTSQTLGVVFWAGLIGYALKTVLSWVVLVVTQNMQLASLNVTSFMPDANPQSLPYVLAGWFGDPFMWWMLFVVTIGAAIAHRMPAARAATVVVATYVLLGAVVVGFTVLGAVMSGS